MCGRVFCTLFPDDLVRLSRARSNGTLGNVSRSYNICPTSCIAAVKGCKDENGKFVRTIESIVWGAKTPFSFIINCRGEELHEKKFFRPLLNFNRCVFIFEGYYEWTINKEPFGFFVEIQSEENNTELQMVNNNDEKKDSTIKEKRNFKPLFMAGLFTLQDEGMIITIEADDKFNIVHHRVPVLLEEDEINKWLDYENYKFSDLCEKLFHTNKPIYKNLQILKIAPNINNLKCKTEECLLSFDKYKEFQRKSGLFKYFSPKSVSSESKHKIIETQKENNKNASKDFAKATENYIFEIHEKENAKEIGKWELKFDDSISKEIEKEILNSGNFENYNSKGKKEKLNDNAEGLEKRKKPN